MPRKRPSAGEGQLADVEVERITGPSSALTSFLRDQGITAEHRARQQRQRESAATSSAATPIDVDGEDEDEADTPAPAPPVASTSTATSTAKGKSKKRKKGDDADVEIVLNTSKAKKSGFADRTPGKFTICVLCSSKFTISPYTLSTDEGLVCLPCERERKLTGGLASGVDGAGAAPKKAVKKKRKDAEGVMVGGAQARVLVPTLQQMCIGLIAKNIGELEDADALGEHLGGVHLDRIAAIVSKNRALTGETVKLFLHVSRRELKLFDCTKLETAAYTCIANLAPNVERLLLNLCGRIDDDDVALLQRRMTKLRRLELYGPFNVTSQAWVAFFDTMVEGERMLDGFLLRQSPRFGHEAIARLAESFPLLTELRLAELGKLTDDSLTLLHSLTSLKYLDISRAGLDGRALSDRAVVNLLEHVGPGLETLILNRNEALSDLTVMEGIRPHCRQNLTHLELAGLTEVTGIAIAGLFVDWKASNDEESASNAMLTFLNLHRCWDVDDAGMAAIIEHSGPALRELDLNSCDQITEKGLALIAKGCPDLEVLDLSMVRATDDFLLKDILDNLRSLRKLSVFGANRVTAGVAIIGQEAHFHVREAL